MAPVAGSAYTISYITLLYMHYNLLVFKGEVLSLHATMIANTASATRILFAMSRDGLLPERMAQTNKKQVYLYDQL